MGTEPETRLSPNTPRRPIVGLIEAAVPWTAPSPRQGKLLSAGVTARNVQRALSFVAQIEHHAAPAGAAPEEQEAPLAAFLRRIDVLWCDTYPGSAPALKVRHEQQIPCPAILCAMGTMPKGAEAMLYPWRRWLRPGDGLLFTCHADLAIWRRLVSRSALREWVAPLPVDESTFHPRPPRERAATRARLEVPPEAPLLLYVGRLNIQKNLHGLLRLLARVREAVPETHLCLVGPKDEIVLGEFGVPNTGYVSYLGRLAAEFGVQDAVRITGPLFGEELAQAYGAADVLVNAGFYHRENFGLSQAEAQACGLPVVCSGWGGFKEIVLPGETGFLMPAVLTKNGIRVDWATGARHVVSLLRDPALRATMGMRAAARARDEFGIAAIAPALSGILAEALRFRISDFGFRIWEQDAQDKEGSASSPGASRFQLGDPKSEIRNPKSAYRPSAFARRYEAHKRACGWYVARSPGQPQAWYPRMFQGRDYAIYETLMEPYATRLARALSPEAIAPDWVPYAPSPIERDADRRLARGLDPVWPHQSFLSPVEWEVLQRIDGRASVGRITADLAAPPSGIAAAEVLAALWRLHVEGFLLFTTGYQRTSPPAPPLQREG